jgi:hypothetical protein
MKLLECNIFSRIGGCRCLMIKPLYACLQMQTRENVSLFCNLLLRPCFAMLRRLTIMCRSMAK